MMPTPHQLIHIYTRYFLSLHATNTTKDFECNWGKQIDSPGICSSPFLLGTNSFAFLPHKTFPCKLLMISHFRDRSAPSPLKKEKTIPPALCGVKDVSEDLGVLGPSLFLPWMRLCNRSFGFGHTSGSTGIISKWATRAAYKPKNESIRDKNARTTRGEWLTATITCRPHTHRSDDRCFFLLILAGWKTMRTGPGTVYGGNWPGSHEG